MALDKFSISITVTLILVFAGKNLICPNVLFRLAKLTYGMGVRRNLFREGKHFRGDTIEIDGTGTNEGTENKNRTTKCVNILIF